MYTKLLVLLLATTMILAVGCSKKRGGDAQASHVATEVTMSEPVVTIEHCSG